MNKAVYYKFMFIITGIWNMGTALLFAILAPLVPGFLDFFLYEHGTGTFIWMYSFLMLVAVFGFKYILVGLDITKNHLTISISIRSSIPKPKIRSISKNEGVTVFKSVCRGANVNARTKNKKLMTYAPIR